jgi:hypothetical protein
MNILEKAIQRLGSVQARQKRSLKMKTYWDYEDGWGEYFEVQADTQESAEKIAREYWLDICNEKTYPDIGGVYKCDIELIEVDAETGEEIRRIEDTVYAADYRP